MAETKNREKAEEAFQLGRCKWFNVAKGWGFISPVDGTPDVFVHQSVIQMSGFRSLGENEEVEFVASKTSKGLEAVQVRSPSGGECKGSERRPAARKKFKKVRCYNCGEFANHLASKCVQGPMPKRCHNCKSEEHLIGDCPTLPKEPDQAKDEGKPDPHKEEKNKQTEGEKASTNEEKTKKPFRPRPKKSAASPTKKE